MKNIKIIILTVLFIAFNINNLHSNGQYDSLKIKISQMLIFGIQDVHAIGSWHPKIKGRLAFIFSIPTGLKKNLIQFKL